MFQIDVRNQNNEQIKKLILRHDEDARRRKKKVDVKSENHQQHIQSMSVNMKNETNKQSGIDVNSIDLKWTAKSVQTGILHWWPRKITAKSPQNSSVHGFEKTLYLGSERALFLTLNQIINFEFGTSGSQALKHKVGF